MPWFALNLLGLPRWVWAVAAVALVIGGGLLWAKLAEDADDKRNVEIGRTIEREEALTETIERVQEAQDVREEVRAAGPVSRVAYDQCVRTARTPANCARLLPAGSED